MVPPQRFDSSSLPTERTAVAPDGSDVRVLLSLASGGMAHFELTAGAVSRAVAHRTVEEIWFVLSGSGDMWRSLEGVAAELPLQTGVCLTIPVGTHFQFRCTSADPLRVVAVTMPPWPGPDEAYEVDGPWTATVQGSQ